MSMPLSFAIVLARGEARTVCFFVVVGLAVGCGVGFFTSGSGACFF
jgi:hypothetical protein